VIMNGGEFKGSGLDKITRKARDGKMVPEWYAAGDYDSIIAYICQETGAFTEFCEWLYAELPEVLKRFKEMW
jgi:hypothetical protein